MQCLILTALLSLAAATTAVSGCYTSLFAFGDSLTDTGNLCIMPPISAKKSNSCFPPYSECYFGRTTGRASNGRLIIDFIGAAEYFDIPLLPPFVGVDTTKFENIKRGVNFAITGSTVLDVSFYNAMGVHNINTYISLEGQVEWFREFIPSLCDSPSRCKEFFGTSLIVFGPLGGNDYMLPLFHGMGIQEIRKIIPLVINKIGSALTELIELGAVNVMVPALLPLGCLPACLTNFESSNANDYDENGCLIWLNHLTKYHNELVFQETERVRKLNPQVLIIHANYYNAAMELYKAPTKYGFQETLAACCGGHGKYNFSDDYYCGDPPHSRCGDPSSRINWDGYHPTEAAYRLITKFLMQEGHFTTPPINSSCINHKVPNAINMQVQVDSFI